VEAEDLTRAATFLRVLGGRRVVVIVGESV